MKRIKPKLLKKVKRVKKNDNEIKSYYKSIKQHGADVCFVCGKSETRKRKLICIGTHPDGKKLMRHHSCCHGSVRWQDKFGDSVLGNLNGNNNSNEGEYNEELL